VEIKITNEEVTTMLANAAVGATIPVVDMGRAKKFYGDTLGLKLVREDPGPGAMYEAGKGTGLYLYQREASKADHTLAGFTVSDVVSVVKDLKAKGVAVQDLDIPSMGIKTVDGVANIGEGKGAWFKDSEGNILAVMDM
jgi:predicted enzyme related to lactoylglutathione lyase